MLSKNAIKNQTEVTLRMSLKMHEENNLPKELLLATRQKNELRNAFEDNMSTCIMLAKIQVSKII